MDVLGTTIAAGTIIYNFLVACGEFSSDAKSLAARFQWDLTALKAIRDYFEQRRSQNADADLSKEHKQLLQTTADYLDGFADEVQRSLGKIERKGLLKATANRMLWAARENDVKKVQQELEYWTDRFGVRVLVLPEEVRNVIHTSATPLNAPALVTSNKALLDFTSLALDSDTKQERARQMLLKDPTMISQKINACGDISIYPLEDGDKQLIFATRRVPPLAELGNAEFNKLESATGMLAAALNRLNPSTDVRLLKVEYYFYHKDSNQFLLAQRSPYKIISMTTLEHIIKRDKFPQTSTPLGERVKLAYKLAEAVVFLHAAGFLHKNITSSSAVALRKPRPRRHRNRLPSLGLGAHSAPLATSKSPSPASQSTALAPVLDDVYLMGFDLVRSIESRTSKEGAVGPTDDDAPIPIWKRDIYMHPERQRGDSSPKYQKAHDVYSLGVVLLEVGLWEPLSSAARGLFSERDEPDKRNTWPDKLRELAIGPMGLRVRVGRSYQAVVEWCLGLVGDDGIEVTEFAQNVLDPLEKIARVLS